jgi:amidohydrolase
MKEALSLQLISDRFEMNSIDLAKQVHQEMIDLRRDFHRHPEIGFELHRTAAIVAEKLKSLGLKVRTGIAKTGVVADLVVPSAKRTIALRADMDALPIQELNEVEYKSLVPMQAHLCGHDAHTAMLLGAAQILTSMKDRLNVNVRFIFQPSEEAWPGGASAMIAEGVLESVEEIYALHVWPSLQVGRFGICQGPAMAQADGFEITITGRGGHAARPQDAIDPITMAAHLVQKLQGIIANKSLNADEAVLTVTQVQSGNCFNVIPDVCEIKGTVRTYNKEVQANIVRRMHVIVEEIAHQFGGKIELKYMEGYPVTYNHEIAAAHAKQRAVDLVGNEQVIFPGKKELFGEDFAYYSQQIPGCFVQLGCREKTKSTFRMLHDSRFDIDEECLVFGAAFFIKIIIN